MDIEIPLQSQDDFGSFELPGALYDSQLDWEIYSSNECAFGEDFRTEFLTDLFGCEQNDYKHGISEYLPEVRKTPILTEPEVPVLLTQVDLDMEKGQSQLELPQRSKKETTTTRPLASSHQFSPSHTSKEHSQKTTEVIETVAQPASEMLATTCETEQKEPVTEHAETSAPSCAKKARIDEEVGALPLNMTEITNQPSLLVAPTETAGTPLARSSAAEPQIRPPCAASSAKRQPPPRRVEITRAGPLHLTDLRPSLLPPVVPRVGRGKRKANDHVLVDDPIEMTSADLRANLSVAKELLLRRADVLAPPASLTHPRRLLSLSVPRLLALPANWETALSACLGDCWKSQRRLCEALSPIDLLEVERPQPSKTSLEAVRESDLEASKEEARAHGTSSLILPPSVSSLIGTSALDMTIQQNTQEAMGRETSTTASAEGGQLSKRPVIHEEEEEQDKAGGSVKAVAVPPTGVTEELPSLLEASARPLPEMPEEPPLAITREEIPAVIPSLVENLETDIQCLATEDSLDRLLERTFKSGAEVLHFSDLLPPSVPRKLAAKALHHLLCKAISSFLPQFSELSLC
ncbi:meiosis-specific component of sister chromatid cohesion complex [Sparganum proliferum]